MGIGTAKKLAALGMALMCLYLLFMGRVQKTAVEAGRMKNVEIVVPSPSPAPVMEESSPAPVPDADSREDAEGEAASLSLSVPEESSPPPTLPEEDRNLDQIQETTITGGLSIKNETSYDIDLSGMLAASLRR